jgi:hypothetical protein
LKEEVYQLQEELLVPLLIGCPVEPLTSHFLKVMGLEENFYMEQLLVGW